MGGEPTGPGEFPPCPSCGSDRVAPGAITGKGGPLSFSLLEVEISPWKYLPSYPTLEVRQPVWLCLACGLLWSPSIDLAEARRQVGTFGTDALKARTLDPADALPRPASAPEADGRDLPRPSLRTRPK